MFILTACQEEQRGQYPLHGIKPSPVEEVVDIKPFPGGAVIYYVLPNEKDILFSTLFP